MIKKSSLFVLVIAILFMISWSISGATQQDEQNLKQKIAQLKEKIEELAVKIERNPDTDMANEWREMRRKYINELEKLLAQSQPQIRKEEFRELEAGIAQSKEKLHELELALIDMKKKGESERRIGEYQEKMAAEERRLEELIHMLETRRAGRMPAGARIEQQVVRLRAEIQELKMALERNPKSERAEQWMEMIQEREQKLKAQLERRKRGKDRPSAYQRERGELTAYVISATSEDVTVRLKDSGKVMVLRVPQWRRVERRRVPNTDMIKMVKKLKKNQLIWARYNEGEERGTYFIQEIKKIKDDK